MIRILFTGGNLVIQIVAFRTSDIDDVDIIRISRAIASVISLIHLANFSRIISRHRARATIRSRCFIFDSTRDRDTSLSREEGKTSFPRAVSFPRCWIRDALTGDRLTRFAPFTLTTSTFLRRFSHRSYSTRASGTTGRSTRTGRVCRLGHLLLYRWWMEELTLERRIPDRPLSLSLTYGLSVSLTPHPDTTDTRLSHV